MTKEQAKEKIKKLLALANRPGTPAEGEAALSRAQALATRHGLVIQRVSAQTAAESAIGDFFRDIFRQAARPKPASPRPAGRPGPRPPHYTPPASARPRYAPPASSTMSAEAKRKHTTYMKAYSRGAQAYDASVLVHANPYSGKVFGVNLREAWFAGWLERRDQRDEAIA